MYPQPGMDEPMFFTNGRKGKRARPLGVCLGGDATTEHECGISPLRVAFGAPLVAKNYSGTFFLSDFEVWQKSVEKQGLLAKAFRREVPLPPMGMEKRKIHTIPEGCVWLKATNGREGFGYKPRGFDQHQIDNFAGRRFDPNNLVDSWDLVGGWSDEAFYVFATSDKSKIKLKKLYEAILAKNAMFTMAMSFFSKVKGFVGGLCILDLEHFPKTNEQDFYKIDKDKFDGEQALFETGIEAYLKKQKLVYYALSSYGKSHDDIWRVWLNPSSNGVNGKHNAGWFTIDELRQWGEGKGPVMAKSVRRR